MMRSTRPTRNRSQIKTKGDAREEHSWRRRPSEIRGFQHTYYLNADNRDYLRLDYNLRDKRLRLYVEVASEGGAGYYSIIKDGTIIVERSIMSGRSFGCSQKFEERSHLFSTIPNKTLLKLLGNNYSIQGSLKKIRDEDHKQRLRETRERYFKSDVNPYKGRNAERAGLFFKFRVFDLIDLVVAAAIAGFVFWFTNYSFILLGVVSVALGLGMSLFDLFVRERDTLLLKILIFLIGGTISYIFGYYIQ